MYIDQLRDWVTDVALSFAIYWAHSIDQNTCAPSSIDEIKHVFASVATLSVLFFACLTMTEWGQDIKSDLPSELILGNDDS